MIATVTQTFQVTTPDDMAQYLKILNEVMECCKVPILQNVNIDYTDRHIK